MTDNKNIIQAFKVGLVTLSPIHIGTGDYIEPFSYVIKDSKIFRYDFFDFISSLTKNDIDTLTTKIKRSAQSKDQRELLEFIKSKFDETKMKHTVHELSVSEDNIKYIGKNSNKGIKSMFYSGTKPIIPGSSLKGAIRTAIIKSAGSTTLPTGVNDPFKILSISDAVETTQKENVNYGFYDYYKKDTLTLGSKDNINIFAEVIKPRREFNFKVQLKEYLAQSNATGTLEEVILSSASSKEKLFKTINKNYRDLFDREIKLIKNKCDSNQSKFLKQLNALDESKIAVMKVGYHSGSMGVTLPERDIKVRSAYKTEPDYFWYFSYDYHRPNIDAKLLYPSGWVALI